jgi:hypothetical protein
LRSHACAAATTANSFATRLSSGIGYGYSGCPLVRRRVWTPYGYRIRWVRRCNW